MTEASVYSGLTDILRDIFMRDDIVAEPTMTAKDIEGWDSFKQIEIIIATEERFGIKMLTKDLDNLKSVGGLAELVMAKAA